jgi:HSP20 family protein
MYLQGENRHFVIKNILFAPQWRSIAIGKSFAWFIVNLKKTKHMYYKSKYGIMPRTIGGIMEEVLQNGINVFHDDFATKHSIPVNIKETDKAFELHVVAPGLSKDEFKIQVERDLLTVSFEKKEESKEQQEGKWLRSEYHYRSFKRSFTLNEKIDVANISAAYTDGVLNIQLPKKENVEAGSLQIAVK